MQSGSWSVEGETTLKRIIAAVLVAAFTFAGAESVLAGEVNGRGEPVRGADVARSDCVFSGLEDGSEGGPSGPGVTQSWGQIVRSVNGTLHGPFITEGADGPHRAPDGSIVGCNAHLYPINVAG